MVQRIRFALFDDAGEPLEAATPLVASYRKADGTEVDDDTWPVIEEKGDGFYEFSVDPDRDGPVAYIVACGAESSVAFLSGSVGPLVAFAMYDVAGDLAPSKTPTFSVYTDGETELPHPVITNLGDGLYGFWPAPAPGKLVQYIVGDSDNTFWGTVGSVQLTNAVPSSGSEITNTTVATFDVKDTEAFLGRVLIAVEYEALGGATELVWDGAQVCGPAFTVTKVAITDGWRYSVLRKGGWPASPKLRVFLTNFGGREL